MTSFSVLLVALHLIAVQPHAFNFEWTPATGPVTGYQVEVAARPFATPISTEPSLLHSIVHDASAIVSPEVWSTCLVRVRALKGEATPNEDCPFEGCGPWSEWSDEPVSRIENPDVNGDNVVSMPEFSVLSLLWGRVINADGIIRLDQD